MSSSPPASARGVASCAWRSRGLRAAAPTRRLGPAVCHHHGIASPTDMAAARERERLRQAELETERLRETVATLEVQLRLAVASREKEVVRGRAAVSAANERARLAQARAVALEVRTRRGRDSNRSLAACMSYVPSLSVSSRVSETTMRKINGWLEHASRTQRRFGLSSSAVD